MYDYNSISKWFDLFNTVGEVSGLFTAGNLMSLCLIIAVEKETNSKIKVHTWVATADDLDITCRNARV